MPTLEIYVEDGCFACRRSVQIAEEIRQRFPQVEVRVVDVCRAKTEVPEIVVATPTFLLNGRVFSLGNPQLDGLEKAILELIKRDGES